MLKPMNKLRAAMCEHGVSQEDIARRWNRSTAYLCARMSGKADFTITEVYDLLGLLKLPVSDIQTYFPGVAKK